MTIFVKQSTASQEVLLGPFVDATDGNTAETALTIANTDIKLHKAGATTLANKNSGGATHISNGNYYAVLDSTDTDTLGSLVIVVQVSGALAVRHELVVLAANVYDSLIGSGDVLDVSVTQWTGTAVASPATAGYPAVTLKVGTGTGEVNLSSGAVPIKGNIKTNAAYTGFTFMMTDSTNHAPATGKTVTVTRSIDGGAFGAGTLSSVTEVGVGIYSVDFGAGDLNGKTVILRATATACDDTFERIVTYVA
jgi:hypothetical protein